MINEDSTATTVNVVAQYPEKTLSELPEAVAYARQIREEILSDYPDLTIYLSGASMLSNSFSEAIATDFQTLIPLMIIIILVTTTLCVRSASATGATLLLIILASMTAMGWAGHAGIKLAGPSPSAIIVILTLAIADSIHILISARVAMQRGMEKRAALVEAIRVNFLAVSITSLTTIVGFMALNFSDSPPFRDFGNISAVGILAAWALSLTMLPALLMILPFKAAARAAVAGRGGFLSGFADFVINRHRLLFVLAGGASAVLIAFIPQTVLTDNFRKYFDERIEFRRDTDALVDYFGF
ncbi:MAG: MMPL family transporter, partial [Pseudomonadota bacterium]